MSLEIISFSLPIKCKKSRGRPVFKNLDFEISPLGLFDGKGIGLELSD